MLDNQAIMREGIHCLLAKLGALNTEIFVANLKEPFDYTEWQREHFADVKLDEFLDQAAQFDEKFPFEPRRTIDTSNRQATT